MTKEELLEMLEIDQGSDFQYFENYADLMEFQEEVSADVIASSLKGADMSIFGELTEEWFDEIIGHIPEDAMDIYHIMEAEKRYLLSLISMAVKEEAEALPRIWDEIERFREWFSLKENSTVHDNSSGESHRTSLSDAIAEYRFAKLDNRNMDFDLSEAGDFIVNEYIVPLGELI